MAAGLKTLELISENNFFENLTAKTTLLVDGLKERAKKHDIALTTNQVGAMFGFFFSEEPQVSNFAQVSACDAERFKSFYHGMLHEGVYLAPSAFEAGFVSSTHSDEDIINTLDAAERVFAKL